MSIIVNLEDLKRNEGIISIFEAAGENYQDKGNRCYGSN
jgi:hypothetical protein